jgi:phosphate transport system substrate-binding protein
MAVTWCCIGSAVGQVRLQGAGATFPAPIYQRWVVEFERINPGIRIDYQSIGSGGGVRGVIERTVDFGASDAPLSAAELERMPSEVVHIPTVAGAVVPAYNLPGLEIALNLTGKIIADIYRGEITRWNDPAIREINPDATLPDLIITPVWRTDGSGTTYVFSSYLARQSEDFLWRVGYGKAVRWPVGRGGKGNEGVTAMVQRIRGSIGYVELNYAVQLRLTHARVQNREGRFVEASPESVSAAGAGAVDQMQESLAVNIWDQPGEEAYPISAFTYIIVYRDLSQVTTRAEAQALVDFLYWATQAGQGIASDMDYAPLAPPVQQRVAEVLGTLVWRGERLTVPPGRAARSGATGDGLP